jgi:broad specificity phosphatase PhoE
MTRTIVHVARHGEVHNPSGVLYGRLPGYSLSDRGREMAVALADWAKAQESIAMLACSPLQRAQETMAPIAERLGLPVVTDDRLIEAENVFEGLKFGVGDGALRRPAAWRHLWNPFKPSWGEPYAQQVARMTAAIESVRDSLRALPEAEHPRAGLCVSHQLPIWILRSAFEGRPFLHDPRRRICSLASVTSFVFEEDRFVELRYAEPAGHLLPPGAKRFVAGA